MSIIQLECGCNHYPWGKKGKESLAAKYATATPGGHFKLDESKEYAEQWMGTYPTTPSSILATGEDLQKHINANKVRLVGKPILDKFGVDLPYLPKILSIAKALPLQIHPSKELAAKLHEEDPEKFGDSNHKPEIAVALGKFEAFVGWKPLVDVQHLFSSIPILRSHFLNNSPSTDFSYEDLKKLVAKILSSSDNEIKEVYETLKKTPAKDFRKFPYIPELLPRLAQQYGKSDPGNLLALLVMNYIVLQKGDAIYVPANGIHAYLSGDIVECMARSDNVLNTGFCPRADRDSINLFIDALTSNPKSAEEAILKAKPSDKGRKGYTQIFAPPMSEFNMLVIDLKAGETETIKPLQGPAIMITTGGKGKLRGGGEVYDVQEGYVFFVGYDTQLELVAEEGLEAHIAYAEV